MSYGSINTQVYDIDFEYTPESLYSYSGAESGFKVRRDEINKTHNINFNSSKNEVHS